MTLFSLSMFTVVRVRLRFCSFCLELAGIDDSCLVRAKVAGAHRLNECSLLVQTTLAGMVPFHSLVDGVVIFPIQAKNGQDGFSD